MNRTLCFVLVAVLAVSTAWCNGTGQAQPPDTPAKAAPKDTNVEIADFTLKDLAGKAVDTAKARKDKVLVLKFGATWCPPCTRQIPHLNKVVAAYPKGVAVIEVDIREPAAKVKSHAARHKVAYPILLDTNGAVAGRYRVRGIPAVIVADKNGKIVHRGHYTPFKVLKAKIDPLLKK